ncbi:hypothetical protein CQZ98_26425 [Pseudomonas sp. MYb115]|jgi:hypothetical protein|nr:hypothetical protein CQZ98_26425 [Pseudomonas sp. MYb115]
MKGAKGIGRLGPGSGCRCSLFFSATTATGIARYLAEKVPVSKTGRQLSLEQVPTVGLRN